MTKVVLTELARQPFKVRLDRNPLRPNRGDEPVQRALATRITGLARPMEDLDGLQPRRLREPLDDAGPLRLADARAPDAPLPTRCGIIDVRNGRLMGDALDGPEIHAGKARHLPGRVAGTQQDLDLVSLQHGYHPPLPAVDRDGRDVLS